MEGSHADFAPPIERRLSFRDQKIAEIAISANFLKIICWNHLYLGSLYDISDHFLVQKYVEGEYLYSKYKWFFFSSLFELFPGLWTVWNKDFFSDDDDDENNINNGQDNHDKDNNDKKKDTTNMTNNMKVERLGGLSFAWF